ncbi:hypothetical protein [Bradyrhizobium elkanii]|uniref:hypothetical protein n=1 Tax=Bradyrhizobium elkanii TaxID=29448 RepID=UPI001FD8BD4C|nr:hypothetical protein [Bradyrhizobium elkanii]
MRGLRQVAATARRYGVSRPLLLRWRRLLRPHLKDAAAQQMGFIPARVVPDWRHHLVQSGPPAAA